MSQIELLKKLVKTPSIYPSEYDREFARFCLEEKLKRRDKKLKKRTQLKLEI